MIFKKSLLISMCMLMLTACGNKLSEHEVNSSAAQVNVNQEDSSANDKVAKSDWDKIVDFQREVIPVLESALIKQFPMKVNKTGTPTIDVDGDASLEQAISYFDNDDVNNLKVVFLVDKEDTKEMKAIRKELEEKLGDKVLFKKAKHNPKFLSDTAKEVADYVVAMVEKGSSSVGYNSREEVIEVEAKLTDEQIADLNDKFGSDILRITNKDPQIRTTLG